MISLGVRVAVVAVCGLVTWYSVTEVTIRSGVYVQAGAGLIVGLLVYVGLAFVSGADRRRRRVNLAPVSAEESFGSLCKTTWRAQHVRSSVSTLRRYPPVVVRW
jgi:hypothetical protein